MKQKYTITISDIEMNVISEESPEAVEALVGIVDRKMREISNASKRCSKSEAALLCSLDYCSDKIKAQRKVKLTACTVIGYDENSTSPLSSSSPKPKTISP